MSENRTLSVSLCEPDAYFSAGQAAGFLTIEQVRELDLGHGEKPDYFDCKSTITFCKKDNCLYKVRPTSEGERESSSICLSPLEGVSEC